MTPVTAEVTGCGGVSHHMLHGRAAPADVHGRTVQESPHTLVTSNDRHPSRLSTPSLVAVSRRRLSSLSALHAFQHLFERRMLKLVLAHLGHVDGVHALAWWLPEERVE